MVRTLCLPQSDPPPLWKIVITTLLIVARWAGLIRKGRVQLKTGLKLWENILQTVRRIDFQIIEVKGIAVIFIYSKSSSLNFQLLVEVVIKNGYGDICMTSTYQFFFFRFIYFLWFLILVRVSGHGNKVIQFGRGNQVFVVQSQVRKNNFCLRGCSSLFWLLRVK